MATMLNEYLGVKADDLERLGVFNSVIGVDSKLFLDPYLLEKSQEPEFNKARQNLRKYFEKVLLLLSVEQSTRTQKEALKLLTVKETRGVSMGYGEKDDGSAIGPKLAEKLLESASEVVALGVKEPEIFEIMGLFEEGFGPDRISDLAIHIIKEELYEYTERICKTINASNLGKFKFNDKEYTLPKYPDKKYPILIFPKDVLRDLPIALEWDDIWNVVNFNEDLRRKVNALIGQDWNETINRKSIKEFKSKVRKMLLSDKKYLDEVINAYKRSGAGKKSYNFSVDILGEDSWYLVTEQLILQNPKTLTLPNTPTLSETTNLVRQIIAQYKKLIEDNGLSEPLCYKGKDGKYRYRNESIAQKIFFAVADTCCKVNNLDVSPECNSGRGPVDFKFSNGYSTRVLVEIKYSKNSKLINGYNKQIEAYQSSEGSPKCFYVVIKTSTEHEKLINDLLKISKSNSDKEVVIIAATVKPSASKL